jgi:hypothetical protein
MHGQTTLKYTIRTAHTTYAAALKTTTHSQKLRTENHMLKLNI